MADPMTLNDVYDEALRRALERIRPDQIDAELQLWGCRKRVANERPYDPEPADEPYNAVFVLASDSSDGPPHAARYFVLATEPSVAALVAPIWITRQASPLRLPDLASRPNERDDGLVIVGQDASGQSRTRTYHWQNDRWHRLRHPLGMTEAQHGSTFLPMFPMTPAIWEELRRLRAETAPDLSEDEWRAHSVRGFLRALHLAGLAPREVKEELRQAVAAVRIREERGN